MEKAFVAAREDTPGIAWKDRFFAGRPEAEAWYRGTGEGRHRQRRSAERKSSATCQSCSVNMIEQSPSSTRQVRTRLCSWAPIVGQWYRACPFA